jgi:hypothetical protein
VCRWFAFEILEFLAGREPQVGHHINRVVDFSAMEISTFFCDSRGYREPDPAFVYAVVANYKLHLRGKTLLQVLIRYLSDSRRNPKYSYAAVIEMCLKLYPDNPYMKRLVTEANRQLA